MIKFETDIVTTTIGELNVGDFIEQVDTQERTRGVIFNSGVMSLTPIQMERGRKRTITHVIAPGVRVKTLTGHCYDFPAHFTVQVRRIIQEG